MNKTAFIELLKSFGRFIWFGLLALISTFLVTLVASGDITNMVLTIVGQPIDITFIILAVIGFVIKGIDTYIHKNKDIDLNGIAPTFLQK